MCWTHLNSHRLPVHVTDWMNEWMKSFWSKKKKKHQKMVKFLRPQNDVIKRLILSDQQFKPHRWSVYCHVRWVKAANSQIWEPLTFKHLNNLLSLSLCIWHFSGSAVKSAAVWTHDEPPKTRKVTPHSERPAASGKGVFLGRFSTRE